MARETRRADEPLDRRRRRFTNGREKYVWFSGTGREQLFDLGNDPQELRDLAPSSSKRLSYWRQKLVDELQGREEGFVEGQHLVSGRPVAPILSHILAACDGNPIPF